MLLPEEMTTFLCVVRAGGLLKAAELLHVSQSTVSYRLGALEKRLGQTLVNRSRGGGGISLTASGRLFLPLAERWEELAGEAGRLQSAQRFQVTVGAAHAVARYLLPPLYARLAAQGDDLSVSLHTGTGPQLEELVATGQLHAAFTLFPPQHAGIEARRIVSSPLRIVANVPYGRPRDGGEPAGSDAIDTGWIDPASLDPDREVRLYWGDTLDDWRRSTGLTSARLWCDSVLMLPPLLGMPGHWSLLPEFVATGLARDTGCAILSPEPAPPPQHVYRLLRRGSRSANVAEVRLLDHLVAELWPQA